MLSALHVTIVFEFEYRKTEGYVEKRMDKLFHTDFKTWNHWIFLIMPKEQKQH